MQMNWLQSLFYGLISGLTEFLPVSSEAHQRVYLLLIGSEASPLFPFFARLGCIGAALIFMFPALLRMRRERAILATPKKRRKRHPDLPTLMESRVLRMSASVCAVLFLAYGLVDDFGSKLWLIAIFAGLNGVLIYLPPYLPGANKTAQSLSGLDALIIGIAAGAGMICGISRIGAAISAALIRGTDRRYSLELALLICIPALMLLSALELFGALGAAVSGAVILKGIVISAASFASAYCGIYLMRFLSVKVGYSAFAYYCWGFALFTLVLYLI